MELSPTLYPGGFLGSDPDSYDLDELACNFLPGGHVVLDLTSHCNLKCVYCHQSRPDFRGAHIKNEILDRLMDEFVSVGIASLRFGTEGEATIYKGWEKYAQFLSEKGISVSFLSNLSRPYNAVQIDALAHAAELTISFDSYDADLHAAIRRKSEIQVMTENLRSILARALALGKKPRVTHNCVVSAHNLPTLLDLVARAPENGIDRIGLMYMIKSFELEDGGLNPIPLDVMSTKDQLLAAAQVYAAINLGRRLGVEVILSTLLAEMVEDFRFGNPSTGALA